MNYKLRIYGGSNIQEETRYFSELADAIESVDGRLGSDPHDWELRDQKLRRSDPNGPELENTVINTIEEVGPQDIPEDATVLDEPVFNPPE